MTVNRPLPHHEEGDLVVVHRDRRKPPEPGIVEKRRIDHTGGYQYRVRGDHHWHTEGNVYRAED